MATVYLALTEGTGGLDFNKLVVIKRLREHLASDPEFVTMLRDEARIAARLNHQNVVQTLEVGEEAGDLFLAMEFLDGQPLNRIRKRGGDSFTLDMQLTILCDVLAGVHYAHELHDFDGASFNLVHRDVTPHNVFVTYDGQVKVLDFGIAKAAGRSSETKHGVVKGKLAYMAPEQARGEILDRRSDIFAVGAMLYETCVGERLWQGLSEAEMMRAIVHGRIPTSPRERNPNIDPELDAICAKALAPAMNDRYATAEDFAVDLEEYMRLHAPRVRARKLGAWLSDTFADKRALTRSTIESQLEEVRGRPSAQTIVPIGGDRPSMTDPNEFAVEVDEDYDADDEISGRATRVMPASTARPDQVLGVREETALSPVMAKPSRRLEPRVLALTVVACIAIVVILFAALGIQREPTGNVPPSGAPTARR